MNIKFSRPPRRCPTILQLIRVGENFYRAITDRFQDRGANGYSQRNTLAESAVQITNTTTSPTMSPICADHGSPFQIP